MNMLKSLRNSYGIIAGKAQGWLSSRRGFWDGHRFRLWRVATGLVLLVLGLAVGSVAATAQNGGAFAPQNPTVSSPTPPRPPAAPVVSPPLVPGAEKEPKLLFPPLLPGFTLPAEQQPATHPAPQAGAYVPPEELTRFSQNAQAVWRKIQRAYSDFVADVEIRQTAQGLQAWLKPLVGGPVLLADRLERRDQALWEGASVADTLQNPQAAPYPPGEAGRNPVPGFSPGRARSTPLLKALYGETPQEVRSACESVNFLGQKLSFNTRHGAAAALRRVVQRLEAHLALHPEDRAWILPTAGTFADRRVAGSEALSAHAFAVAIDLNPEKSPYWRWNPAPAVLQNAREHFPQAIVDAFEAEGFIWGGKWHAFDFMHFEYRPELLD